MTNLPNLGNAAEISILVMLIVYGLKKAKPKLAGGLTVALAGALSGLLAIGHTLASVRPLTGPAIEAAVLTGITAWLLAIGVSLGVRSPLKRTQIWKDQ